MKSKAIKELHTKTVNELKSLLQQTKDELFSLKMDFARRKLKNTSSLSQKRKDITRILTILKQKEVPA